MFFYYDVIKRCLHDDVTVNVCVCFPGLLCILQLQSESVLSVLQLPPLQQPLPDQQQHQPRRHHRPLSLSASRPLGPAAQSQPGVTYRSEEHMKHKPQLVSGLCDTNIQN